MPTPDHDLPSAPETAQSSHSSGAALRSARTVTLAELAHLPDSPVSEAFAHNPDLRTILSGQNTSCWTINGLGLVGFGRAAHIALHGADRFTAARSWWEKLTAQLTITNPLGHSATGPVAFAAFSFSHTSTAASGLVLPELVIGHDHTGAWATLVSTAENISIDDIAAAWRQLVPHDNTHYASQNTPDSSPRVILDPSAERTWCATVSDAIELMDEGQAHKLVLARCVKVHSESGPLDISSALQRLATDYNTCWTYSVRIDHTTDPTAHRLFGATPERLVRVLDGQFHARVLAGTVDRAKAPEQTDGMQWAHRELHDDPKQRAEHDFAVTSLLESVAAYTQEIISAPEPFVLELPNVWHLASDLRASLAPGPGGSVVSALELVEALHPTAAVCGTPTEVAAAAIAQLEGMDRGLYAGPVGWVDSYHNGDFGIALRGAVQRDAHTADVYAGCGVLPASVPEDEWAETQAKLRPVVEALGAQIP